MAIPVSESRRDFRAPRVAQARAFETKPNEQATRDSSNLVGAMANLANTMAQNAEQTKADAAYTEYFNTMSALNSEYLKLQGKQAIDAKDTLNDSQEKALGKLKETINTLSPQMQNKIKEETSKTNMQFKASNSAHLLRQTIVYEDSVFLGKQDVNARRIAAKAQQLVQLGITGDAFDKEINKDIQAAFSESMNHYVNRGLATEYANLESRKVLARTMETSVNALATNVGDSAAIDFLNSSVAKKSMTPEERTSMLHTYQKDELSRLAYIKSPFLFNVDGSINTKFLKDRYTNLTDYEKEVIIKSSMNSGDAKLSLADKKIVTEEATNRRIDVVNTLASKNLSELAKNIEGKSNEQIEEIITKAKDTVGENFKPDYIMDAYDLVDSALHDDNMYYMSVASPENYSWFIQMKRNLSYALDVATRMYGTGKTEFGYDERRWINTKDMSTKTAVIMSNADAERQRTGFDSWFKGLTNQRANFDASRVYRNSVDFFEDVNKHIIFKYTDDNGVEQTADFSLFPADSKLRNSKGEIVLPADFSSQDTDTKFEIIMASKMLNAYNDFGTYTSPEQARELYNTLSSFTSGEQRNTMKEEFLNMSKRSYEVEMRKQRNPFRTILRS